MTGPKFEAKASQLHVRIVMTWAEFLSEGLGSVKEREALCNIWIADNGRITVAIWHYACLHTRARRLPGGLTFCTLSCL
jgi:hypothetical protein